VREWVFDRTVTALESGDVEALRNFGIPHLGPFTREALDMLSFPAFDASHARSQIPPGKTVLRARDILVHVRSAGFERIFDYGTEETKALLEGGRDDLPSVYVHHDRSCHSERMALLWMLQNRDVVEMYVTHRPCISCLAAMVAYRKIVGHGRLKVTFDELDVEDD